jgi:MFS family permease
MTFHAESDALTRQTVPMDDGRRWRLAGMMALNYAVQGAWWPLLAVHLQDLGISGRARGWIFATTALASLLTPLGAGQIADRHLPTQRLLGTIYALGAALLAVLALGLATTPAALFALFLLYWLITAPGYGLSNALAFRNLPRPVEQFGGVRLWGTIGWMIAGWLVTAVVTFAAAPTLPSGSIALALGAVLSVAFSVYCFRVLPDTPPLAAGGSRAEQLREGLELLRKPELAAFLALALGVSLTMPFVYQTVPAYLQKAGMPRAWIASAMTLSQVPEILGLAALPWLHRRLGLRGTMILGIAGWAVEYLALALEPALGLALLVIPFNGIAIAGFVISGQMYLDSQAPPSRRAGTQALWVVLISGLGQTLGNLLAGELLSRHGGVGSPVFLVPGLLNLAAIAALAVLFRPGAMSLPARPAPSPAPAALAAGKLAPADPTP